jgi:DHA2 family multidrug resistance protein
MSATELKQPNIAGVARILLIATAMICAVMELVDSTIVNVALPEISGAIGATRTEIAWLATAYSIGNIIIIPLSGMLSNLFGRKAYFTGSVILFTFGSFMCGVSGTLWQMILWRCIQGIGGGGLLATAQSIVIGAFPEEKINTANTIFGLGLMIGPILGPVLGGIIVEHLSWHWIFFINLPIGAIAAVGALLYVPDLEGSVKPKRIDGWGITFLAAGIGSLEFVLEEGGIYDWFSSTTIIVFSVLAGLNLIAFVILELSVEEPAVNLRLLKNYNLAVGSLMMMTFGGVFIGVKFIFPLFVRTSLGWTAIQTGSILMYFAIGAGAGMLIFKKILDTGLSPKIVILIGLSLSSIQLFLLSYSTSATGTGYYIFPLILGGLGIGAMMIPMMSLALAGLRGADLAQGTGLTNLVKRLGSVIGIALLNIYLDHQTAHVGNAMASHVTQYNSLANERIQSFKQLFVSAGYATDRAMKAAHQMMGTLITKQQQLVSYDHGYFLMGILLLLICVPIILLLKTAKKNEKKKRIK